MKSISSFAILTAIFSSSLFAETPEKTVFQTADGWRPELDLRSDVAIVYGVNASFPERVKSWRDRGYGIHLMTGIAWGEYQDYLLGKFDGKNHQDEGQVDRAGNVIWHHPGVPYMVPSPTYIEYMKGLVKKAIDAGVTAIHLEEPEFWNRGGYSEGFKREWQAYYGEPWQAQYETPEATYRSAKLKYHLYFRALKEIFSFTKEYSEKQGRRVRCYVPTHTLLNYSAWGIVSPESSLADLPGMDGYIGQVWTGTARTPTIYDGVEKERTFENAYLEYHAMSAMTQPTGRRVYFLTDPIEDNPNHTWEDYKKNYEATFTAQLMVPSVCFYEVMPWPSRIFLGRYQVEGSSERQRIPSKYAGEILILINALNDMESTAQSLPGTAGIGVLLSDTMMFQRFPAHGKEDPRLSNFYGMALPFLKQGIPVRLAQMENLLFPDTLKNLRVLLMSYAHQKPLKPEYHDALAQWVKNGGALIYLGRDDDPFQSIREWWNQGDNHFKTPSEHLFQRLGLPSMPKEQTYKIGKGLVTLVRKDPLEFALAKGGGEEVRAFARRALAELGHRDQWQEQNRLHLQRGPYDIVAVLDESHTQMDYTIPGPVIDLFDADLPVYPAKKIQPGERAFLLTPARCGKQSPIVLAAASRVSDEQKSPETYSMVLKGPAQTQGIARVWLPRKPVEIETPGLADTKAFAHDWDDATHTLRIRYPNSPDGVKVIIHYGQ